METENTTVVRTTSVAPDPVEGGDPGGSSVSITSTELAIIITMLSIMSVVGIVGNALAIYVFASLKQKLTSTIFILTLAGTDFITCLITIPYTITIEYLEYRVTVDAACKIYHFLITTTVPFSCVVIVAIAVDRYMCICHPFHHWMNIQRARIIIGVLAVIIFIFGGIVCMHYSIYKTVSHHINATVPPDTTGFPYDIANSTAAGFVVGGVTQEEGGAFTAYPYGHSPGPSYSQEPGAFMAVNETVLDVLVTGAGAGPENATSSSGQSGVGAAAGGGVIVKVGEIIDACDINEDVIDASFFKVFQKLYTGIFMLSCIIVLVLYSLIYRSVIAQRRKKLRIKSAQCCLLWNATSVDSPHEAAEMTQDIELSHVNGDERFTKRHNSNAAEEPTESHNGALRKCSLSKARIERMRVANIKTAFTLFIVTLVFIFAFLPAWLMALSVLQMNVVVFYMYFIYNVVNPFIYAFLNQNFKTELSRILHCGKQ
ncbi:uncharacterized protein LOC101857687 [Aplysia californica]|uniref:Uncharacterized protein LOC101857687 n=1 Tax=Aplysia californica TaxID=6500 RepID=A0ABM1ACN9_APLCA|nr:uncharacterized protein LOC101857687 [Aplysia californica]